MSEKIVPPKTGYRKVLEQELKKRIGRNPKYSIRAFARDLGMAPAQLIRILNSTRNLSLATAKEISPRLLSNKSAQTNFIALVELESTSKGPKRQLAEARIEALASMNHEAHAVDLEGMRHLQSWVHFAILDLLGLKNPPRDTAGIADYLGLTEPTVNAAIKDLKTLDLLEDSEAGLKKKYAFVACPDGVSSDFIKAYHRQMIERGLIALAEQDINKRYFFGETLGIKRELYPELQQATEEYFHRVSALARLSENEADSLYQVNVQVFDHKRGP